MKTNNPIIQIRLNQLIDQKTTLLKLKKHQRGNQLKSINETINRLKGWIQDSGTMIESSNPVDDILKQQRIVNDMERDIRLKQCPPSPGRVLGIIDSKTGEIIPLHKIKTQNPNVFHATFHPPTQNQLEGVQMNHMIIDDIIDQDNTKTPEIDGKPSTITDKWLEETPEAYKARFMDVTTVFRKMNGFG